MLYFFNTKRCIVVRGACVYLQCRNEVGHGRLSACVRVFVCVGVVVVVRVLGTFTEELQL